MSYRSMDTLPTYAPSKAFNGIGEYFESPTSGIGSLDGLGAFTQAAAGITGIGNLTSKCPMGICGLGAEPDVSVAEATGAGIGAGVVIGSLAISAVVLGGWIYMGYKIGQDLSPPSRNWGVGGALVSLLGPFAHWGYGIMALSNGR